MAVLAHDVAGEPGGVLLSSGKPNVGVSNFTPASSMARTFTCATKPDVARACPARRISAGGSAAPVIIYAAEALTRSDACAGWSRALGCPGKQLGNSVEAACGRAPRQDRYQPTDDPAKCQTSRPTTWRSVKLRAAGTRPSGAARQRRQSMPHQHRHIGMLEHIPRNAAEDHLTQRTVRICAHHQHIVAKLVQLFQQRFAERI